MTRPGVTFILGGSLGQGIAIFGRGADNALWAFTGNQWASLGGRLTSKPAAAAGPLAVPGGESLDVAVRGADGAVWDREINSTATRSWASLGGRVLAETGPAAVNDGGTLYVLAVGTDRALWMTHSQDSMHWSGWRSPGGQVTGDVAASAPAAAVGAAFARGADNAAWHTEFTPATTLGNIPGWHRLGGRLTSGVGAASEFSGMTWILVMGADNHIWMRSGPWTMLSGWTRVF